MTEQPESNPRSTNPRLMKFGLLIVGTGIVWIAIYLILRSPPAAHVHANGGAAIIEGTPFTGITAIDPPRVLSDFTLTRQDSTPFSLSELRGHMALIYFGYTHCPDVCPLTLAIFKQIKQALGTDADQVAFVFISVDGERDTPQVMSAYLTPFDPSFIGLTGDKATLTRIGTDYDLYFEKRAATGNSKDYTVDHSSNIFLIDREGRLSAVYTNGISTEDMVADIETRLQL